MRFFLIDKIIEWTVGNSATATATIVYVDKAPDVTITATPSLLWPPDHKLVPAVKAAPDDAVVIADGFSCREQIQQCTSREALHLAQAPVGQLDGRGGVGGAQRETELPKEEDGRPADIGQV